MGQYPKILLKFLFTPKKKLSIVHAIDIAVVELIADVYEPYR